MNMKKYQVGKVYRASSEEAFELAVDCGVQFDKVQPFEKWVSVREGIRTGACRYTPVIRYDGYPVSICFCKFYAERIGVMELVKVPRDASLDLMMRHHASEMAEYLV